MAGIIKIIAATGCFLCLFGCGKSFEWEGTWTGTRDLPLTADTSRTVAVSLKRISLTIKPDQTFELIEAGVPRSGQWSRSQSGLKLQTEQLLGRGIPGAKNAEARLERLPDGSISLIDAGGLAKEPVTLSREAQPKN